MSTTATEREHATMWTAVDSPIGELRIVGRRDAAGEALTAIEFSPFREPTGAALGQRDDADPLLREAVDQLAAYFAKELRDFDLPLDPRGSTFQKSVWDQLAQVPYGQTASYGDIARRLGRSNAASRAVGLANGSNPLPIVIPCHRIIGASGSLTGYAGGLRRKQLLLELEQDALF